MRRIALAASLLVMTATTATADYVPPIKGNDTGGIIATPLAATHDVRRIAWDHCASYGKMPKLRAVQPYYGGYISFECVWPRLRAVPVYHRVIVRARG